MLDELNNEGNKATGKKIDWAKKRFTPKEIKNSEAAADEAGKAEDAERGAVAIAGEATKDETHASHQADGLVKKMQAEEGLPDKPVELPSAGDMQLNATAAAEAGVEKPPTVVGATAALVGTGVDSDGDCTKVVHDPSNPNRESAGVDQKMLDELNNEVNKATGKKIDWAKKRFTPKEIKNSEAAADEAGKAE